MEVSTKKNGKAFLIGALLFELVILFMYGFFGSQYMPSNVGSNPTNTIQT
jgi:hypothetical protein